MIFHPQLFLQNWMSVGQQFGIRIQAHSNDNTGRCRESDPSEPSLLTIALRHRSRIHICISKGDYRKVSCLGEHNTHGTSPPWGNKQGNYRICL